MNDAVVGLQRCNANYKMEPDRNRAIAIAIHEARPGDIVLIAGKGHEKIQVIGDRIIPFDDVGIARESLQELGYVCETAKAIRNNP